MLTFYTLILYSDIQCSNKNHNGRLIETSFTITIEFAYIFELLGKKDNFFTVYKSMKRDSRDFVAEL